MGKSAVTYAIGYTQVTHHEAEIRKKKRLYKRLRDEGREISAARTAIEIAELLIEVAEQPSSNVDEQEEHAESALSEAITLCRGGYTVLDAQSKQYHDAIKALELIVDAYRRLKEYDDAVEYCKKLVARLRETSELLELRNALRMLGDIYFERGHEPDLAKFDDFENARIYYLQERDILDSFDVHTKGIDTIKCSLDFNLGIIEAKFIGGLDRGEEYLVKAIKSAHCHNNYEQERRAWWELSNVFKKKGDIERVIRCQAKELQLIDKHHIANEKIPCLIESVKTHLELDDFDGCLKICDKLNELVDSEDDENEAMHCTRFVLAVKAVKDQLATLPDALDLSTINTRGNLYFKKARLEFGHGMHKAALASVETGIQYVDQDSDIKLQLPRLRIALMQLRAELVWRIREMSVDELIAINNGILSEIKVYFTDKAQRIRQLEPVYERMAEIHYYFERKEDYRGWVELLNELQDAERNILDQEDENAQLDYWSTLSMDYALDAMDITGYIASDNKTLMNVTVMIPIDGDSKGICVPIDNDIRSIGWLMARVPKVAWEQYGVEPCVRHLRVGSSDLAPHEVIVLTIKQGDVVEAIIDGFAKKTPVEIYQNACFRMSLPALTAVEEAFRGHQHGELHLSGTGLSSGDVPVITEVLKHIPPLHTLNLSANLLYDQDIANILKATPGIQHLDLKSNRLSYNVIPLLDFQSLESLDLSFNSLGPDSLAELPLGLKMWPSIKQINLIYCDIGGYFRITKEVETRYEGAEPRSDLLLDLRDNDFGSLMLTNWRPLWDRIVCHSDQIQL